MASEDRPVYHLHGDHFTFKSVGELQADATTIVEGSVLSAEVEAGESPGVDEDGSRVPGLPSTYYRVRVGKTFKGDDALTSQEINVALTGGATEDADFVLEGVPSLDIGQEVIFFLIAGDDGRYYPLAGGAAVAQQQEDGSYKLSTEVTGGTSELVFREEALTSPQQRRCTPLEAILNVIRTVLRQPPIDCR